MPDGGGEGEEPDADAHGDAGFGAAFVAFEAELAFEGLVDRFDDLAQGPQELCAGPWGLGSGGRAHHGDADVVEVGFERSRAVAVVGDEGLARPGDPGRGDHVRADFALVGFRAGDRERDRQPCRGGDKVQPQTPEVPRMRRAPAVLGPSREVRALLGLAAGAALHRGGVHQPHVVVPRLALACETSHDTCDHLGAAPQPLVVAVAVGQIGEPRPQMRSREPHELRLVVEPQQRRDHRQGDQLRVRQLRGEPHHRPPRSQPRVLRQQVIDPHIQCGREGVQVRAHAENLQDRSVNTHPELGHPHPTTGGPHPLELII